MLHSVLFMNCPGIREVVRTTMRESSPMIRLTIDKYIEVRIRGCVTCITLCICISLSNIKFKNSVPFVEKTRIYLFNLRNEQLFSSLLKC
jgi:hypothetical protein